MLAIYSLVAYGAVVLESTCGLYKGNVTIDGKDIPLLFDTGSNSLWINEKPCSSTEGSWDIKYDIGEVSGTYCASAQTASIGGCAVSVPQLATATSVSGVTDCTRGTLGQGR